MATNLPVVAFMAPWITLVVFVLFVTSVLWRQRKRRARKEREFGSKTEEGRTPLQGSTAIGMAQRWASLQPQRRDSPVAQQYIGGPVRRPALARTRPGLEMRKSYPGTAVSSAHPEPRRYSSVIPDAGVRGRVTLIHSDPTYSDAQSTYRQTPNGDNRASLASTITPGVIHSISTLPVSPSARRRTLSSGNRVSLPSTQYRDSDSIYPVSTRRLALALAWTRPRDTDVRGHVSLTHSDPTYPDSQPTYRQTPEGDNRASLASTITPRTISTLAVPPSARRRTLSSDSGASLPSTTYPDSMYPVSTLPSYPGTARSASPPAYSDLSRTPSGRTSGGSSRGVSFRDESAVEPIADLTHLEEAGGRA